MVKKVLFVITKSNFGGAQRYLYDLATALPKEEFEAAVAFGGTGEAEAAVGMLGERLASAGVRTLFVSAFMRDVSLWREFKALRELFSLFRKEKPDVVHLNSSKAGGVGALAGRLAGVRRIVFTSHGLPWDEDRGWFARLLIRLATWATFLLCHRVITVSQDNHKRARKMLFCSRKVRLIHNGVGTLQFMTREEARAALGLPIEAFVIGSLGELTWNKNYHALIRAAGVLKRKDLAFILCIIGDGDERQFLTTLTEEHDVADRVVLAGYKEDGYKYLKAFDIFAMPSLKEGLPYALIEAGQAKLAVVGSRISGITDITRDGEAAILIAKPKAEGAVADALETLLKDSAKRGSLAEMLHERATTEFSLGKMAEDTAQIYRE